MKFSEEINTEKVIENYKRKVFKTIEKFRLVVPKDKIFVALSGGKDSTATLAILKEYVETKNLDVEISAYHINLGFHYSDNLQKDVEKICENLGVKLYVTNLKKEYSLDILKIAKITRRPVCSVCGLVKRYLINKVPRELGATKVATGHNLMDFLVNYFKNLFHGNIEWNLKILPKLKSEHPKQLTKIRPVIFAYPEENKLYCDFKQLPITQISCPFSKSYKFRHIPALFDSKIYEILEKADKIYNNFSLDLLKSIIRTNRILNEKIRKNKNLKECSLCGELTSLNICGFCRLIKMYKEKFSQQENR